MTMNGLTLVLGVLALCFLSIDCTPAQISYTFQLGYFSSGSTTLGVTSPLGRYECYSALANAMIVETSELDSIYRYLVGFDCYGSLSGNGYSYSTATNYEHKEFLLLLLLFKDQPSTVEVAETIEVNLRQKVNSGTTYVSYWSIDSLDNDDQLFERSSRLLLQSHSTLHTAVADQDRNFPRHNKSRWVNGLEEVFSGPNDMYNSINLRVKMGDSDVKIGHRQWFCLMMRNPHYNEFTLISLEVTRQQRQCQLVIDANALSNQRQMVVIAWINITTNVQCNADILELEVILHAERQLSYRNHTWGELSMIPGNFSLQAGVIAFNIPRFYIDSYVYIEIDYEVSDSQPLFMGTKNMTVAMDLQWKAFEEGSLIDHHQQTPLQAPITTRGNSRFYVEKNNKVNETTFSTATHDFQCKPPSGSGMVPCYMFEKASGSVKALSPFIIEVIGQKDDLVYGRTLSNHVICQNANDWTTAVISQRHWLNLLAAGDIDIGES